MIQLTPREELKAKLAIVEELWEFASLAGYVTIRSDVRTCIAHIRDKIEAIDDAARSGKKDGDK